MSDKNYSEMSDFEINEAVSMALLHESKNPESKYVAIENYCNSWADAGPIIEENKIDLSFSTESNGWYAEKTTDRDFHYYLYLKPLRAAMIVFLMAQDAKTP